MSSTMPSTRYLNRAVATGQVKVSTWLLFFPKLPEFLPVSSIRKWAEPVVIKFDITVINCAWIIWSYYDRTHHLDCRCSTFTLQNAPEMLSNGLNFSGACPQHTHAACVMQMPHTHLLYLTTQNFMAMALLKALCHDKSVMISSNGSRMRIPNFIWASSVVMSQSLYQNMPIKPYLTIIS